MSRDFSNGSTGSRSRASLHKPLSNRSLIDSIPTTPTRLPSPNGNKMGRRLSTSSISNKSWQSSAGSSRVSRRSSMDALPMLPSRCLSPMQNDKIVVEISDQVKDSLKAFPFPDSESRLKAAVGVVHSPIAATESSSESRDSSRNSRPVPQVNPEVDPRLLLLSRLPQHIKDQLPEQEWYKLMEPAMSGSECLSVHSDISDDLLSLDNSHVTPTLVPEAAEAQVHDDVYGTDDEDSTSRPKIKGNQEESKMDREAIHSTEDQSITQDDENDTGSQYKSPISGGSNKPTEQQDSKPQYLKGDRWMDSHILAYDAICCTDDESKQPEMEDEPESAQEERNSPGKQKKRVSFGNAQVRYHERILVVHPSTSSGPSVGIGWDYTESEEAIEWGNQTSEEMRLTRRMREEIVGELGYSQRDVAKAVRETLKIKNQRRRTINNLKAAVVNVEKVESMAENAQRKIRKLQKKFRIRKTS